MTLLDTPNQLATLIFHTDGSCLSQQGRIKDGRVGERREVEDEGRRVRTFP